MFSANKKLIHIVNTTQSLHSFCFIFFSVASQLKHVVCSRSLNSARLNVWHCVPYGFKRVCTSQIDFTVCCQITLNVYIYGNAYVLRGRVLVYMRKIKTTQCDTKDTINTNSALHPYMDSHLRSNVTEKVWLFSLSFYPMPLISQTMLNNCITC